MLRPQALLSMQSIVTRALRRQNTVCTSGRYSLMRQLMVPIAFITPRADGITLNISIRRNRPYEQSISSPDDPNYHRNGRRGVRPRLHVADVIKISRGHG